MIHRKDTLTRYVTGFLCFHTVRLANEKIDTCIICVTEPLCCTPETNTALVINYTPI